MTQKSRCILVNYIGAHRDAIHTRVYIFNVFYDESFEEEGLPAPKKI